MTKALGSFNLDGWRTLAKYCPQIRLIRLENNTMATNCLPDLATVVTDFPWLESLELVDFYFGKDPDLVALDEHLQVLEKQQNGKPHPLKRIYFTGALGQPAKVLLDALALSSLSMESLTIGKTPSPYRSDSFEQTSGSHMLEFNVPWSCLNTLTRLDISMVPFPDKVSLRQFFGQVEQSNCLWSLGLSPSHLRALYVNSNSNGTGENNSNNINHTTLPVLGFILPTLHTVSIGCSIVDKEIYRHHEFGPLLEATPSLKRVDLRPGVGEVGLSERLAREHPTITDQIQITNHKESLVSASVMEYSVVKTTGHRNSVSPTPTTTTPPYLNLPLELWQHIYRFLPHSALLEGALVCSAGALSLPLYCQSQIWASVGADDWVVEGIYQGLRRNAHLLRKVECTAKSQLQVLTNPDCRSITHLDTEQLRFLNAQVLEQILDNNAAGLLGLRVRMDRMLFQVVAGKVGSMKGLKELYVQHWEGVHQEAIATLLEACPHIETLSLGCNSLYPFQLDNLRLDAPLSKTAEGNGSGLEPIQLLLEARPMFKIRSLILDGSAILHEGVVLNLASRCPELESLSMKGCYGIRLTSKFITTLANATPLLRRVNFTNQSVTDDFYSALFTVIPGLKELRATGSSLTDTDIRTMLQNCALSLEALDIGFCTSLESRSVLALLTQCPALEYLDARGVDFNPRDMDAQDTWVCRQLVFLYLEILLPKRAHYTTGEPELIRDSLYRQLSRLDKLKSLHLGAGSKDRGVNILELSLLTGLSSLSTLTRLEKLDIKQLNHAVRSPEVIWMLAHWPRLKAMAILLDTNADVELIRTVHRNHKHIRVW
ncbi:F-box and leucine-rich repeat protein 4 [Linnemannia exigua]|uniref:F-box and leucine-rich repeat protein 4 n=1 Tax=Linnemannia exigua TaxID=604196 RepID=A0AAD4H4W6_9FUNG|nr:F-box and leucine-rich repeat protein 4 [Linnemannia exigua]